MTSINKDSPALSVGTAIEMEDLENNGDESRKQSTETLTPAIEMVDVYKRYRQNCVSVLNGLDLKKCHSRKV